MPGCHVPPHHPLPATLAVQPAVARVEIRGLLPAVALGAFSGALYDAVPCRRCRMGPRGLKGGGGGSKGVMKSACHDATALIAENEAAQSKAKELDVLPVGLALLDRQHQQG
jgi:hypothetical protein